MKEACEYTTCSSKGTKV